MLFAYLLTDGKSFACCLTDHTLSIPFLAFQNGDIFSHTWLSLCWPAKSNEFLKQYLKIRVLMIMTLKDFLAFSYTECATQTQIFVSPLTT